jgi:hypothetical protein
MPGPDLLPGPTPATVTGSRAEDRSPGDRIHAIEQVALDRYGLDLTFAWPRLWLVLPENVRAELNAARQLIARAEAHRRAA